MNRIALMSFAAALIAASNAAAQPAASSISVDGEALVATLHAEGAQIYECRLNSSNALAWQFREPIATLFENGQTVGRHYAGPHWELSDGSIVAAKVAARAPGASSSDIPLLKLEVTQRSGNGRLCGVTTIQRINTRGGVAEGACSNAGSFLSVPYSADYTFFKKIGSAPQPK